MSFIYLLPIETGSDSWVGPLEKQIEKTYGYRVKRIFAEVNIEKAYDRKRSQYNSSEILLQVISKPPRDAKKIVAVVEVDLFIPILTFVFGEAQLEGIGSIVSMHRLNNKFYGLKEDDNLLTERIIKEVIHELGHTFGLVHCSNQTCVMRSSTYVEDIDFKSHEMCSACQKELEVKNRS